MKVFLWLHDYVLVAVAAAVIAISCPAPTLAQDVVFSAAVPAGDAIVVPWGDWAGSLIDATSGVLGVLALGIFTVLLGLVPAWVRPLLLTSRVDQLIEKAVQSALASVKGAVAGKEMSVEITNEVVREAVAFILTNGAPAVIKFMGDELPKLIQKVLARLEAQGAVPAEASIDDIMRVVTPADVTRRINQLLKA